MAAFDSSLWYQRAWSRHQKLVKSGQKSKAASAYSRDAKAIQDLAVVLSWCADHGITVNFTKKSGATFYNNVSRVDIAGRMSPERQLHSLLHECGHYLIGERTKKDRYGMGWTAVEDANVVKTMHHRLDVLEEEFEAWYRGLKLARRLKISLNKKRYDKTRIGQLKTYVDWAARVNGYSGGAANDEVEPPAPKKTASSV